MSEQNPIALPSGWTRGELIKKLMEEETREKELISVKEKELISAKEKELISAGEKEEEKKKVEKEALKDFNHTASKFAEKKVKISKAEEVLESLSKVKEARKSEVFSAASVFQEMFQNFPSPGQDDLIRGLDVSKSPQVEKLSEVMENEVQKEEKPKDNSKNLLAKAIQKKQLEMRQLQLSLELVTSDPRKFKGVTLTGANKNLPIYKHKDAIIELLKTQQVLILVGATGCGKTTQLPQYLAEIGCANTGKIGCTQLRRIAARSTAKRVAKEMQTNIGDFVGYSIRFRDCTSKNTIIQFMTDRMMLNIRMKDRLLSEFSAIILDESHERTTDTDLLLGTLKDVIQKRPDLKLVISSATLDKNRFSEYFGGAPVYEIKEEMYPVEVKYHTSQLEEAGGYVNQVVGKILEIHTTQPPGDILVFLTGEQDIEMTEEELLTKKAHLGALEIIPIYSLLPMKQQKKIFVPTPKGKRKVVLATNIAETSLTIDGIRYVIDVGYVKQKVYDHKKRQDVLEKIRISRCQAIQRMGRAGRTGPGICYRMYTETQFRKMSYTSVPEIQRCSLNEAILILLSTGFRNALKFDYMDAPDEGNILAAMKELYTLNAVTTDGKSTFTGRRMAMYPVAPYMARMLVAAETHHCMEEIATIVAMLEAPIIFYSPKNKRKEANAQKAKFLHPRGDLFTLLNVYGSGKAVKFSEEWCQQHFIYRKHVKYADEVRSQLLDVARKEHVVIEKILGDGTDEAILKCICAGFYMNIARKTFLVMNYTTIPERQKVYIHPSSALFKCNPEWVLYESVVKTSKEFMRNITAVDQSTIMEIGEFLSNFQPMNVEGVDDNDDEDGEEMNEPTGRNVNPNRNAGSLRNAGNADGGSKGRGNKSANYKCVDNNADLGQKPTAENWIKMAADEGVKSQLKKRKQRLKY